MNYTAMTPTQLMLAWPLIVSLLVWMITFLCLALRSDSKKRAEAEEFQTVTRSFSNASARLHVVASQSSKAHLLPVSEEAVSEVSMAPAGR